MATGGGVFDNAVMFKSSSANLTKTGTYPTAGLKIRGTAVKGSAVRIVIPHWPGTAVKLTMAVQASKNDSAYHTIANYASGAQSRAYSTTGEEFMIPFAVPSTHPYVKLSMTVTNGTTGTTLGAMVAGIVPRAHGDWTRAVRYD